MATGSRRLFSWSDVTGDNSAVIRWGAEEIAKRFGLKKDEHLGLIQAKGREETLGSGQNMLIVADEPRRSDLTNFLDFEEISIDVGGGDSPDRGFLWLSSDPAVTYNDMDAAPTIIEVFESIEFKKAAAATWVFALDFVYLEGPMRWPVEDYMKDLYSVDKQRSAGNPYYQPGRDTAGGAYHQPKRTHT